MWIPKLYRFVYSLKLSWAWKFLKEYTCNMERRKFYRMLQNCSCWHWVIARGKHSTKILKISSSQFFSTFSAVIWVKKASPFLRLLLASHCPLCQMDLLSLPISRQMYPKERHVWDVLGVLINHCLFLVNVPKYFAVSLTLSTLWLWNRNYLNFDLFCQEKQINILKLT